ncbi:DUF481 domain-containing protein [Uliginosibacterium sediminicola]|uniref:DUF481 domain-containing protein n=1 Tax=Uliginosibacterium sediminicola TaxID=2024550 RepID=A0ABU9YXX7_9RHOO
MNFRLIGTVACLLLSVPAAQADTPAAVDDPIFSTLAKPPEQGEGKWQGSLGMGFTLNRGNDNSTQASFSGNAVRAMRDSRLVARALVIRNSSSGERTSESANLEFRGERSFDDNMFGFGDAQLERDVKNDLSLRQSLSAGIGRRLYDEEAIRLNLYGGLAYAMANFYEARDGRGFEPMVGEDMDYKLSETSRLGQRFVLFPTTVGAGGMRTALQADITTRITDRFGLQVAVLHKYREQTNGTSKHNDLTIFTGLTSKF